LSQAPQQQHYPQATPTPGEALGQGGEFSDPVFDHPANWTATRLKMYVLIINDVPKSSRLRNGKRNYENPA
jgi:hypothetical protein